MSEERKPDDPRHNGRLRFCQEMAAKCPERDRPYWELQAVEEMKRAFESDNPLGE